MNDDRRPSWPGEDPDGADGRRQGGGAHRHRNTETDGSISDVLNGQDAPRSGNPGRAQRDAQSRGNAPNGGAPQPPPHYAQRPSLPPQNPPPQNQSPQNQSPPNQPPPWSRRQPPQGPPPGTRQGPPGNPPQRHGPPQQPPEGETELLPLVDEDAHHAGYREPELFTHRDEAEDEPVESFATGGELEVDDQQAEPEPEQQPRRPRSNTLDRARARRKRRWRRVRRTIYVAVAAVIIGPILGFLGTYLFVNVPSPEEAQANLAQPVNYYFNNNSLITTDKADGANRTVLKANKIPDRVKHATEAAEDASFENNSGFDFSGILRAVWKQVSGQHGGGSTISQQYVKQATGNDQHSYMRKAVELVKSYKMTNQQSKKDIITAYLNTIYYGRGAYGIQAASKAYFNVNADQLTKPQAATLSGLIQAPGRSENVAYRTQRADYVMDQMVKHHWMSRAERAKAKPPKLIPVGSNKTETQLQKHKYLIAVKEQIDNELASKGLDANRLRHSGAKIHTSIDPKVEKMAVKSNNKIMSANSGNKNLVSGQVSINPKTGGIVAYYPGQREKTFYDQAAQPHQPGSSFKPFTFLSLLENKHNAGLGSTFDGTDNQKIKGVRVKNADGEGCGKQCTVKEAMTKSVNTVFYNMAAQVGTQKVRDAAWQAGISKKTKRAGCDNVPSLTEVDPKTCKPKEVGAGIALGQYPVSVKDMAQAYGTFFHNGMKVPAHFVTKVTDSSGEDVLYQSQTNGKPAFDKNNPKRNARLASTVLDSMKDVASFSGSPLNGGRPNAAKTGTAQAYAKNADGENTAAWMVGGTPQVVNAVYVGDKRNSGQAIHGNYSNPKGSSTNYPIYGREEPSYIWSEFLNNYLEGKPTAKLPNLDPLGKSASYSYAGSSDSEHNGGTNGNTTGNATTEENMRSRNRGADATGERHTGGSPDTNGPTNEAPDTGNGDSGDTHAGDHGDGGDHGGGDGGDHGGGDHGGDHDGGDDE